EIARIQKQRPLPKCFRLWRYLGPQGPNRLDSVHLLRTSPRRKSNDQAHRHGCVVDRYDSEPNTRFISAQAWSQGHAWGTFSGGSGQIRGTSSGGAQVFGKSPIEETNTVLPSRAVFGRPFADHPATDGSPCFNPWDPATEPFSRWRPPVIPRRHQPNQVPRNQIRAAGRVGCLGSRSNLIWLKSFHLRHGRNRRATFGRFSKCFARPVAALLDGAGTPSLAWWRSQF